MNPALSWPRHASEQVRRPVMTHDWNELLFVHWPVDPQHLAKLLPAGLEPDVLDGAAFVGIIPFLLTVRPFDLPVPVLRDAPEINLRTYVRGPDAGRGVYFLSLELGVLWAAAFARYTYRLPYRWSEMAYERSADSICYASSRRPRGAPSCRLEVEVGEPIQAAEETFRERFLSARWRLYARVGGVLLRAHVEHPPWQLHRAALVTLDEDLLVAAGLPRPQGDPEVLYSPGTTARFGPPRPVLSGRAVTSRTSAARTG